MFLSAALCIAASFCTYAADFGHEQTLTINGKPAYLAETSPRVLANQNASPNWWMILPTVLARKKYPATN